MHSGPFGCLTKLGAKRAELVQKFVPRSRVGIFRNERTRSTLLNPKVHFVLFVCIRDHLVALGNPVQNGRNWCKSSCHESRRNFSQRMNSIHPIGPQIDILVRFILFGCIRDHLVALRNSVENVPNKCKSSGHEIASEFFATNVPDPRHWMLK